jgi:hypothetical protein
VSSIGTTAASPSGLFAVQVLSAVPTGQRAPLELYRRVDGRVFVIGHPGQPYVLSVRNRTSGRIEVVSTVDGRNTLEDEPGSLDCRGLVFAALSEGEFTGFRLNSDKTRQFIFSDPGQSVAAQATGSTENAGIIGLAAYSERKIWQATCQNHPGPLLRSHGVSGQCASVAAASADMAVPSLGTAMGQVQDDRVTSTRFTRSGDADLLAIGYGTREHLEAMGVFGPPEPNPFPATGATGYANYA